MKITTITNRSAYENQHVGYSFSKYQFNEHDKNMKRLKYCTAHRTNVQYGKVMKKANPTLPTLPTSKV